eukprot:407123-Karenia_brevis.AAC.1
MQVIMETMMMMMTTMMIDDDMMRRHDDYGHDDDDEMISLYGSKQNTSSTAPNTHKTHHIHGIDIIIIMSSAPLWPIDIIIIMSFIIISITASVKMINIM